MTDIYPYNTPIILTDAIFQKYMGLVVFGSSTPEMRQIAFVLAEEAVTDDIGTLLLPTIVTGTWSYDQLVFHPLVTDFAYVNQVILTRFIDFEENIYYTVSGTANEYVSLRDDTYGIIDINYMLSNCHCSTSLNPYPYQIQVVYKAGLSSGTSFNPKVLMALSTYADLVLNQMEGYGNEADGLVGVDNFKNQDYSEVRHNLKRTIFGSSARAQFVSDLLTGLRKHRYVGL